MVREIEQNLKKKFQVILKRTKKNYKPEAVASELVLRFSPGSSGDSILFVSSEIEGRYVSLDISFDCELDWNF